MWVDRSGPVRLSSFEFHIWPNAGQIANDLNCLGRSPAEPKRAWPCSKWGASGACGLTTTGEKGWTTAADEVAMNRSVHQRWAKTGPRLSRIVRCAEPSLAPVTGAEGGSASQSGAGSPPSQDLVADNFTTGRSLFNFPADPARDRVHSSATGHPTFRVITGEMADLFSVPSPSDLA